MSRRSLNPRNLTLSTLPAFTLLLASAGCSDEPGQQNPGTGGAASGGTVGVGGSGTGGVAPSTGGAATGGAPMTGGASSGGAATGGAATGGAMGSGGATGGAGTGGGSSGGGLDDYNDDFEELVGADCDLPEPMALASANELLPDPFLMSDGSRMSSTDQWACQRAWLQKSVEGFIHGEKPPPPDMVTGTVSNTGVSVQVSHGGNNTTFMVPINLPNGATTPVPAMFQSGGTGVPTTFLHGEGVAAMSYTDGTLEGAFNDIYGGGGVTSLVKHAWAISRVIDVLVAERDAGNNDIIDPTALGTTGCSRSGKSAFVVGAFDERIALGIPMESGTGGLGSIRVVDDMDLGPNGGEDPEQVSEACGSDWLTGLTCSGNVDTVPADIHFMVAMYAPRGFTTLQNDRIGHLGPVAQFTSAAAGAEVYKAFGMENRIGYHGGNDGDPHGHCSFNPSQEETVEKAIRGFLTRTEDPANFMEPKLKNAQDQDVNFDLENYRDWDTPTVN